MSVKYISERPSQKFLLALNIFACRFLPLLKDLSSLSVLIAQFRKFGNCRIEFFSEIDWCFHNFFFAYIIKTGNENKHVLYLIKVIRSDLTGAKTSTYRHLAFVFYLEHKYRSLTSRSENGEFCAARFRDWDCAVDPSDVCNWRRWGTNLTQFCSSVFICSWYSISERSSTKLRVYKRVDRVHHELSRKISNPE